MTGLLERMRNIDMLHGSLWDKIVLFSLPLALTSVLQQLFNTADVSILGHFVSDSAMAAVGNNTAIIGLTVALFVGLSIGANVVMARYIGMGDEKSANDVIHTSLTLAALFGLLVFICGLPFADAITDLLKVPDAVRDEAALYLKVYLFGMPFIAVYNFESALFRSKGDTGTPLIALLIASVFNLAADLFVVIVLNEGVAAVALTTVLANALCAVFLFLKLKKAGGVLRLTPKKLLALPQLGKTRAIIKIGLPAGIQGMVFSLSNLLIQAAINSLGADAMAASAAGFTIEINVFCFLNAFGLAATTFIGQNYGAGNLERCRLVTQVCLKIDLLVAVLLAVFFYFTCRPILSLFTASETVISLGVIRILFVVMPEVINAVMEILSGSMRGYGYSFPPALATLVSICGVRVIYVYTVFDACPDYTTLMAVYPLSWLVCCALLIVLYIRHQKSLRQSAGV